MNKEYIIELVQEEQWLKIYTLLEEKFKFSRGLNTQVFEPHGVSEAKTKLEDKCKELDERLKALRDAEPKIPKYK